ncbi:YaiO family outer membrane beta-barrel protein [Paraburkholderia sp. NMBU_R16]|uniref:YaiO family outer membrane beta-barrel protein n=1 Tax=Paraburkholderia sp. NMBU_R16 TaxID=2698676 RepID=UPI0015641C10|nr:YaiO family outer membrane beta-barrel protein [Paraburkholderia sp. NMBU_R16]
MQLTKTKSTGSGRVRDTVAAVFFLTASSMTCAQSLEQQAADALANDKAASAASNGTSAPLLADVPNRPSEGELSKAVTEHVAPPSASRSELDLGYSRAYVTNNYGDWYGVRLRGLHQFGNQTVTGELSQLRRFGQSTTFGAVNYVRDFDADWFGAIGFSGTTSGTILPSERVDLSLNRKVLPQRNLVLSLGAGYAWNRSGHRDQLYHAGVIWYATPKLIGEIGMNYNVDAPGSVKAPAYYAAVSYGTIGKSVLGIRGSFGREAYQAIGAANQIVDFRSNEIDVQWRYWITKTWGAQLEFNAYHNPYYSRRGFEISLFHSW